jgi:hypothetical protein
MFNNCESTAWFDPMADDIRCIVVTHGLVQFRSYVDCTFVAHENFLGMRFLLYRTEES